jgi:ATP-grasp domain
MSFPQAQKPPGAASAVRFSLGAKPKLLLVAMQRYLLCSQLALAFERIGFEVEVGCDRENPVRLLRNVPPRHDLGILSPLSLGLWGAEINVRRAIDRAKPDLVVPCDDQAARILRRIGASSDGSTKQLIESSLGPVSVYPLLDSRSEQIKLARSIGVPVPHSMDVSEALSLAEAAAEVGLPAFLKRDGTWGGEGVVKVGTKEELGLAWVRMSHAHTVGTAFASARCDGWRQSLARIRRKRPTIQLQAAVTGRPANRAVLCKDGEVLAGISVLAVETASQTGPASVVRVIESDEMERIAARLAGHLKANGFLGFDFIVTNEGEVFLLEINARPTPSALLPVAGLPDLLELLFESTAGWRGCARDPIPAHLIALFPHHGSRYLGEAYHYLPHDEPQLIASAPTPSGADRAPPGAFAEQLVEKAGQKV